MQLYKLTVCPCLVQSLQLPFQKAYSRSGKGAEEGDRGGQRSGMAPMRGMSEQNRLCSHEVTRGCHDHGSPEPRMKQDLQFTISSTEDHPVKLTGARFKISKRRWLLVGKEADLWSSLFRSDLGQDFEEGSAGNKERNHNRLGENSQPETSRNPGPYSGKISNILVLSLLFLGAFAYSHSWKQDLGLDQPSLLQNTAFKMLFFTMTCVCTDVLMPLEIHSVTVIRKKTFTRKNE